MKLGILAGVSTPVQPNLGLAQDTFSTRCSEPQRDVGPRAQTGDKQYSGIAKPGVNAIRRPHLLFQKMHVKLADLLQ